jgi:hypothetical protein
MSVMLLVEIHRRPRPTETFVLSEQDLILFRRLVFATYF